MGVTLEIRNGADAGKVIALRNGETVTVGRAAGRAQYPLPQDTFLSGVHFAVECGASGCRLVDRKSSNGTLLNGAKIQEAMLANGDEIKAGQTIFRVRIVSDDKIASMTLPQQAVPPAPPPSRARVPAEESRPSPQRPAPRQDVPPSPREAPQPVRPPAEIRGSATPRDLVAPRDPELAPRQKPEPPPAPSAADGGAVNTFDSPLADAEPPRVLDVLNPSAEPKPWRSPEVSVKPPVSQRPAERPAVRSAGSRGYGFSVMGWSFPAAPPEWQVQEGFGLQRASQADFPSSVAATEESLGGITLQQYVESQISTLRGYLRSAKIEATMPPRVTGADESLGVDVRHSTKDGTELVYRRIYARSGAAVGVLTVTTLASELGQVLESLQPMLDGAAFRETVRQ